MRVAVLLLFVSNILMMRAQSGKSGKAGKGGKSGTNKWTQVPTHPPSKWAPLKPPTKTPTTAKPSAKSVTAMPTNKPDSAKPTGRRSRPFQPHQLQRRCPPYGVRPRPLNQPPRIQPCQRSGLPVRSRQRRLQGSRSGLTVSPQRRLQGSPRVNGFKGGFVQSE